MTDLQAVPEQRSWNLELVESAKCAKLPKKTKLPEKFELRGKRAFKPMKMRKKDSCPPANFHS